LNCWELGKAFLQVHIDMTDESKDIRIIDGAQYSEVLLKAAEDARKKGADGVIGPDDAKLILESKEKDDLKKQTINYIRKNFKFSKEADQLFRTESKPALEKSASSGKPGKKARTKSSEKIVPLARNDRPQRKRKASARRLEADDEDDDVKSPKYEEETKKRRRKRTKGPLYCVCRKPYSNRSPMIGCDSCDEWYHLKCVGMSQEDADAVASYKCDRCERGEPPLKTLDNNADDDEQDGEGDEDGDPDLEDGEDEAPAPTKRKGPPAQRAAPAAASGAAYSYPGGGAPATFSGGAPSSAPAGDQYYADGGGEDSELAGIQNSSVGDIRGADDDGEGDDDHFEE